MEPHTGLNNLDYLVLGVIVLSGLLALMRGFVREVLSLGVWIGAYFAAAKFYPMAEPWTRAYIKSPSLALDAAAVVVFVFAFVFLSLISFVIAKFVRGEALTALDRSLGFLFGLFRGVLLVCLAYLIATAIFWPDIDKPAVQPQGTPTPAQQVQKDRNAPPEWLIQAHTRPYMDAGALWLKQFVPEKQIETTTEQYIDHKPGVDKMEQKALDTMSTPVPTGTSETAPSYDQNTRGNLDHLIQQKGGSP